MSIWKLPIDRHAVGKGFIRGIAAGSPRRPQCGGELEQHERVHLLREGRRAGHKSSREPGSRPAISASAPSEPGLYIYTLMIQEVLGDPEWLGRMTVRDLAPLSPLLTLHINPYGRFELNMDARIPIEQAA